jgi:hypothetical protein
MAEQKEIFNILKDANGDGEAPDLREEGQAEGDAKSHAILPVIPMKKLEHCSELEIVELSQLLVLLKVLFL